MMNAEDIPKMPMAAVEDGDLPPKTSIQIAVTPFINFRKSFKRFKHRKKRPLQEDPTVERSKAVRLPKDVNSSKAIANNSNKVKHPPKDLESTMNILKRLSAYRASKKTKKNSLSNLNVNIVKWSSCESISDGVGKVVKHNSLRRSRASLLLPMSTNIMNGCAKKIPLQYCSMNSINNNKKLKNENRSSLSCDKWYSSQYIPRTPSQHDSSTPPTPQCNSNNTSLHSSRSSPDTASTTQHPSPYTLRTPIATNLTEEVAEQLSLSFPDTPLGFMCDNSNMPEDISSVQKLELEKLQKRAKIKKSKSHSLSLPNICENKIEENVSIDIDINDYSVDIMNNECALSYDQTDFILDGNQQKHLRHSTNSILNDKLILTPTDISDMFSMYLSNDSIFASSMSINRPPVPSVPKPIGRRDILLKSQSTEALTSLKKNEELQEHVHLRKKISSSSEWSMQKRKEVRNSVDFMLTLNNEAVRLESMNGLKSNLQRGCTSSMDLPNLFFNEMLWKKALSCQQIPYAIAEAVWCHASLDPEELNFLSGDVLHVLFMEDDHWWWGTKGEKEGWFPATYVRQCVIQEIGSGISCRSDYHNKNDSVDTTREISHSCRVADEEKLKAVRAKCVEELLTTEKDYVQLLKNIIEGYLVPVRNEEQLFCKEDGEILFSNIEELYLFHQEFVKELQAVIDLENMERSSVGNVFLRNENRFEIYSQYCNNQPKSSARLSSLTKDKKYKCFFERCRLKQNMIRLSLDGFMLSPVQRICKYPLQLKELLKHTNVAHDDYEALANARTCMQNVASLINERKRRLENVNNLALWQHSVANWRDEDIALKSNELLHTGLLSKVISTRVAERVVYLFDHQLIYFRKYTAKRHHLSYCGRIDLDNTNIVDIEDNTLGLDNISNICYGWKMWDGVKMRWHLFYSSSAKEKEEWLTAFKKERKYVEDETTQKGLKVSTEVRETAIENAHTIYLSDLKRRRLRRKATTLSYTNDFPGFSNSPLHSKLTDLTPISTSDVIPKRRQRSRRKNSFRWSLGSMFEKYL